MCCASGWNAFYKCIILYYVYIIHYVYIRFHRVFSYGGKALIWLEALLMEIEWITKLNKLNNQFILLHALFRFLESFCVLFRCSTPCHSRTGPAGAFEWCRLTLADKDRLVACPFHNRIKYSASHLGNLFSGVISKFMLCKVNKGHVKMGQHFVCEIRRIHSYHPFYTLAHAEMFADFNIQFYHMT